MATAAGPPAPLAPAPVPEPLPPLYVGELLAELGKLI